MGESWVELEGAGGFPCKPDLLGVSGGRNIPEGRVWSIGVVVDKRELKCACVGGGSTVPLGFVSLTENMMMVAMGIWMPLKAILL